MADNCALPKICGKLNLPYQAFAFSEIVPSASFRMGITVTLVPLWILLISRSRSWYLSTFSSQVVSRISWSAGTALSIIVNSCVSLCTTVISGRLRFSRLSMYLIIIPRAWMGLMGYWLRGHEGERNNCFSNIQLLGQKYRDKITLASWGYTFLPPKSWRFSLLVSYNI